jgi:hypothetical protein
MFAAHGPPPVATRQLASRLTEVRTRANFVRSSDLTQAIPLTTGTFNLIVKDRLASPPERRVFSPERTQNESACPRNLLKISFCLRRSQLADCTGFPQKQHSAFSRQHSAKPTVVECRVLSAKCLFTQQNAPSFPLQRLISSKTTEKLTIGTSRSEDDRLRKDRLEVLAIRDLNLA